MSSFTSQPHYRPLTEDELPEGWRSGVKITKGFQWDLGHKGSSDNIRIPKGFVTNFASIPRIVQFRYAPDDARWVKAAILHDRLYSTHYSDCKVLCDAIFFQACLIGGTPKRIAWLFFLSLLAFGNKAWDACI